MAISQLDLEKINRYNFRICMEVLSRPGTTGIIESLFGSPLNALACCLLYPEVSSYFQENEEEQQIRAITGSPAATVAEAEYLFCQSPDPLLIKHARSGSLISPELSATLFFMTQSHQNEGIQLTLSGPGIETTQSVTLPVDLSFIQALCTKNKMFPLGVDIFFLTDEGSILGIPRTTRIEVSA